MRLESDVRGGITKRIQKRLDSMGKYDVPISETMIWQEWVGGPNSFWYATPEITTASRSDRILFAGTNVDIRNFSSLIEEGLPEQTLEETQREIFRLYRGKGRELSTEQIKRISAVFNSLRDEKHLHYISDSGLFWETFFDTKDFIDDAEHRTIPKRMIATENMRAYNYPGGEGMYVETYKRFRELKKQWTIPLNFIKSLSGPEDYWE